MKLSDAAIIHSGLVLSRKKSDDEHGIPYKCLSLRAMLPDGRIDMSELDIYIAREALSSEYISSSGDLIVRLTAPYTAVLISEETAGIVVSSNFLIIQADRDRILPEYLLWLLSSRKVKNSMYQNSASNVLGAVRASYFTNLNIAPVSLDKQETISNIFMLARKEAALCRQLAEEKEKYYMAIIDNYQREVRKHD